MDEPEIRRIVRDEMQRNYSSGAPTVPPHTHDSASNLGLLLSVFQGVNTMAKLAAGQVGQPIHQGVAGGLYSIPLPIIVGHGGGTSSQFDGGDAPDGTILFFTNDPLVNQLWVRYGDKWFKFDSSGSI